jgi:hypothetical protein
LTTNSVNRATLSLATTDDAKITSLNKNAAGTTAGRYYEEMTLSACLTNYPTICGNYVIRVYIEPCKITSTTSIPTTSWILGHTSTDISVAGTQVPACGYAITSSAGPLNSAFSAVNSAD